MAGRRPAHAGQAAPCRGPRVRAACGGMRVHGPVLVGAAPGQALEAGHRARSDGFAESKWAPGSAQVDFGRARAVVADVERVVRFPAVSFPCSNMRWVAALPGETAECVCRGLPEVFERMGMAPGVVVFDNAVGVGHRNADGTAARTRLFSLFCAHYGSEPRFRDPYSGHGKGGVENAVGFRGARPDGADAVGRGLPGVGPRVARRHPRRGRRMRVRGHRQRRVSNCLCMGSSD